MEITERISTWKSRKELQPENLGKDYDLEISERITTWKSRKGLLPGNLWKDYTTWKSMKGLLLGNLGKGHYLELGNLGNDYFLEISARNNYLEISVRNNYLEISSLLPNSLGFTRHVNILVQGKNIPWYNYFPNLKIKFSFSNLYLNNICMNLGWFRHWNPEIHPGIITSANLEKYIFFWIIAH